MPASPQLTCAVAHVAHVLLFGVYISLAYRVRAIVMSKDSFKALLDSKAFKIAHATQINNTEWSPYFVVLLLYLHVQGAGSTYAAYGSVLACVAYSAGKLLFVGKPAPLSAGARYIILAALAHEVYQTGA